MENKCECGPEQRLAALEERTRNVELTVNPKRDREVERQLATLQERTQTHAANLGDHNGQINRLEQSISRNEAESVKHYEGIEKLNGEIDYQINRITDAHDKISALQAEAKTFVTYEKALVTGVAFGGVLVGVTAVLVRLID